MLRAVLRATVSPCSRATTRSAMSMPAEIPAEVSTLPSSTTCSLSSTFTAGNNSRIRSSARQCVVARRPSSRPAWPSSSEPVQTDVSVSTCFARSPIQPTSRGLVRWARVPHPPGTTRMSSGGQSSSVWSGITFMPPVVRTGPAFSATSTTSNGDGSSRRSSSFSRVTEKTSNGPQKSSTSASGNNTIPTRLRFMVAPLLPPDPELLTSRAARRACPLDAQRSRARERLPHGLGRMLRAASGEVLEEQALLAHDARVVGAQQVHPLVAQREQARGLEAHDGDAAPRVGDQPRHVPGRVLARLVEHALGDQRPAAALAIDEHDAIAGGLQHLDGGLADRGGVVRHERVVEEHDLAA